MNSSVRLPFLLLCTFALPLSAQTTLESGVSRDFTVGPVNSPTLFMGDYSYVIDVPANATKLTIELAGPSDADLDLFARFNQDVALRDSAAVADHSSTGDASAERIEITPSSSPALRSGKYYIAYALFTTGRQVRAAIKATVTAPAPPATGPALAAVLNLADGTAAIAPGSIVSLWGSRLATTTLKAGSYPMPASLAGSSVEVTDGARTVAAPLYYVSDNLINAQFPYEITSASARVRVKSNGSESAWITVPVVPRAPRVLTLNQQGFGDPIMQRHPSYALVTPDDPAKAGEVVILYMIGLGATDPPIGSGVQPGDGAAKGPLNWVREVSVTVGDTTAEVLYAGLAGDAGLYEVIFKMPAGVVTGSYALSVRTGSNVSSQDRVKVATGDKPIQLANIWNSAACNLTSTSSFSLAQDAWITKFSTWYRWNAGETSVNAVIRRGTETVFQGPLRRGSCDANQQAWCLAETPVDALWAAGAYSMTAERGQVCANSESGNQGFVTVMGAWQASGGWRSLGSKTIGAAGGAVGNAEFSITVPAGAFSANTEIKVSKDSDSGALDPHQISAVYRLEGLPERITAPITVEYDAAVPSIPQGKVLVLWKFEDESERGPMVLEGTVAGKRIRVTLPAMPAGSVSSALHLKDFRAALADAGNAKSVLTTMGGYGEESSPSKKFVINYPADDSGALNLALDVGNWMDPMLPKIKATGLDIDRRKTKIHVFLISFGGRYGKLFKLKPGDDGLTESELWGKQDLGLSLNLDSLRGGPEKIEETKATAGHELFHVFQSLYDPRATWRRTFAFTPWLWLLEATATWFEKSVSGRSDYLALNAITNRFYMFSHGLEYPPGYIDAEPVQQHGYGASTFVDFLAAGNSGYVGELIAKMEPSSGTFTQMPRYGPVEAIKQKETFIGEKWNAYVQTLMDGGIHPKIRLADFINAPDAAMHPVYTFETDADTGKTFDWTATDLSARMFIVRFKNRNTQWKSGTPLKVTLTDAAGGAKALIYREMPVGTYQLLGTTKSTYSVANAEQIAKNGGNLYIVVANGNEKYPFTGTNPIRLTIEVDSGPGLKVTCRWPGGAVGYPGLMSITPTIIVDWSIDGANARLEGMDYYNRGNPDFCEPYLTITGTRYNATVRLSQFSPSAYPLRDCKDGKCIVTEFLGWDNNLFGYRDDNGAYQEVTSKDQFAVVRKDDIPVYPEQSLDFVPGWKVRIKEIDEKTNAVLKEGVYNGGLNFHLHVKRR